MQYGLENGENRAGESMSDILGLIKKKNKGSKVKKM